MNNQNLKIETPNGGNNVLLHCCCAPCSGGIIKTLKNSGIIPTVLFYNPNIQPKEEYELRKRTLLAFLSKETIPFIDADYDPEAWISKTKGMEGDPQRGERCSTCFSMRLEYCAKLAKEKGFTVITSTFGISRWKDIDQVNTIGKEITQKYGIIYWDFNWRKNGGQNLMLEISRQEQFYQQTYCGCKYSQ